MKEYACIFDGKKKNNVTLKHEFVQSQEFCDNSKMFVFYNMRNNSLNGLEASTASFEVNRENVGFTIASSRCRQKLK